MHPSSSLLVLLSASASLAAAKTTTTIDKAEASCSAALDEYVEGIPTVPTALLDAVATNTGIRRPQETGDVCNIAWPSEVQSDIREYGSSVLAWYSSHEQSISTLFSQCPDATAYGYVSSCADLWATYSAVPNSASATATATQTKSASKTASKSKSSATPNSSSDDDASTTSSSESSATTPAGSSTFTTATSTSASTAGAASSSTQGGAAPKETGMRITAVAVAGLVAAAAAL
ncbi:unnamed protein product [Clonostachys chloroleuca]|uniref:Infection structure specific protein n=1 Tax=Clonostachys chloroleuca TaxID=1926264 RepID=A0AA35Q342_9HYPO|nr:unnamed protein product [Clonostachys chloroleuca]